MGKALKLLQLKNDQLQDKLQQVANMYESAMAEFRAYKAENGEKVELDSCSLEEIKKSLEVIDRQEAVQRYNWMGFPLNFKVKENEVENFLYRSNSSLMLFYDETRETFCLLPWTLSGSLDEYAKPVYAQPIPFASDNESAKDYLSNKVRKIAYNPIFAYTEEDAERFLTEYCVILNDYTGPSNDAKSTIPRKQLQDIFIQLEAEAIKLSNSAIAFNCGQTAVRYQNEDEANDGARVLNQTKNLALKGIKYIPTTSAIELQELGNNPGYKAEEYFMAAESYDNLRRKGLGLANGGMFNKKAHLLQSENDLNQSASDLVMEDGLFNRQTFCNIANSIFMTHPLWDMLWCEPAESQSGADVNGDGVMYDREVENTEQESDTNELVEE